MGRGVAADRLPGTIGVVRETLDAGLCDRCRWQRLVPGVHTVFSLCIRALTDPAFRKYPPLPVRRCPGFEPPPADDEPGRKTS